MYVREHLREHRRGEIGTALIEHELICRWPELPRHVYMHMLHGATWTWTSMDMDMVFFLRFGDIDFSENW